MSNVKQVCALFLLTIFLIAIVQFSFLKANSLPPPPLIVNQAEAKRTEDLQYRQDLFRQGKYDQLIQILTGQEKLNSGEQCLLAASYQQIGQISLAVQYWFQAQQSYTLRGNYQQASYCLLQLVQGYVQLGRTAEAISLVKNWPYPLPAFAHGILGNAYLVAGKYEQAIASYQQALKQELDSQQRLAVLNNLGDSYQRLALKTQKSAQAIRRAQEEKKMLEKALQASTNAKKTREEAWLIAQNHSHPSAIKAKLNWLEYDHEPEIIELVAQDLEQLPTNHRHIEMLISLARVSEQPEQDLHKALRLAQEIEDYLGLAMTSAELGKIYEQQQKYDLALSYTEQAEQYIYPLLIYDYLYQYQWQEARIYQGLNQPEAAKSAYRRALDSLQEIHPQIALAGKNVQFDFQESIEPIYRGLLKLLLKDSPSQSDLQQSSAVFDRFQLAQLENLFADICFEEQTKDLTHLLKQENIAIVLSVD